jgi:(p)ppGpp synthase/HD superfamily hydrolase
MSELIERAKAFAAAAHEAAGCTYGAHPFTYHLEAVDAVLVRFGHTDPVIRAAAALHDVVEDTPTKLETIKDRTDRLTTIGQEFGETVMWYVDAVTDMLPLDGRRCKNRRERQILTYGRLRWIARSHPQVINLKLADRIANFEASATGINSQHFSMYQTEHPFFCRQLGMVEGDGHMWHTLDRLATIDPRRGPVRRVCNALRDPGPHPEFHEQAKRQLQNTWPTLYKALDDLLAVDPL